MAAFSAHGDVYGAPTVQGTILDMNFGSPAGGVGRLPDLPIFTVNIPVKAGLAAGTKTTFSLDVTPAPWNDAQGNPYTITVVPGSVTVGGTLTVGDVRPIQVSGTGFDPGTQLAVDGVSVSSFQVVSSQEIDFTLGAPVELQGKRVRVQNSNGEQVTYFPSLPAEVSPGNAIIFPLQTWADTVFGPAGWAVQNTNMFPVTVTREATDQFAPGTPMSVTVAPGGVYALLGGLSKFYRQYVTATAPVRMIGSFGALNPETLQPVTGNYTLASDYIQLTPTFMNFVAQPNAGAPASKTIGIFDPGIAALGLTQVSSSTLSGGNWLSAVLTDNSHITVSVKTAGLSTGTYFGAITVASTGDGVISGSDSVSAGVRLDVVSGALNISESIWCCQRGNERHLRRIFHGSFPGSTSGFSRD